MSATILIGLVTHGKSRFNQHGAATQQLGELRKELIERGFRVTTVISDRNEFTDNGGKLRLRDQISAAYYQTRLESEWKRYVGWFSGSSGMPNPWNYLRELGMFLKRSFNYTRNRSILDRLMNIDLSHLNLMRHGLDSDWVVILEDDALASSIPVAARSIGETIHRLDARDRVFVNLSESFAATPLGVDHIISHASQIDCDILPSKLLRMPLPITNTVCANLYSRGFTSLFRDSLERSNPLPSYPIDWRLNKMLMEEAHDSISCYWVRPGVFAQGSMI